MRTFQTSFRQTGATLIELMVGLTIGLLVVAVAMGALMISRGVSGSVSDASGIQQQGAYLMRVIGQQLRQTGSLYLNPDPSGVSTTDVLSAVVFEIKAKENGGNDFDQQKLFSGKSDSLTTAFRRYQDNVFFADNATDASTGTDFLSRNCVGAPSNTSTDERVESIFTFTGGNLLCQGNSVATAQPIAQNVAQLEINYLVQTTDGAGSKLRYYKGSDMPTDAMDPTWRRVQGVRVCLVLYGIEAIDTPAGSTYTDCKGDKVTLSTLTGNRKNRMHLVFTSTFQLRSQGLLSSDS
jgi:type IV pilus assembly protein PilW